jgi:hypothetical protein
MSIESGLVTYLMAQGRVTTLISTRLYPVVIPQDASLPAAAYQLISGDWERQHDKRTGGAKLRRARIQITVTGVDYDDAKEAAAAIEEVCDSFRGQWGTEYVQECRVEALGDGWGAQVDKFTTRMDLAIIYR